jgi:uncharacterized protein YecE (DUF72 family)
MEFGRVSSVEGIDHRLPPDDRMTDELWGRLVPLRDETVRRETVRGETVRIHVGCTEWGRKNWVGKVYPAGAKEKDFLAHYVKQFNTIELNTLFYHLQPRHVIEKWAAVAGPGFRFCPKFSDTISHKQQLVNVKRETDLFIERAGYFGDRLGPCFLQLSEQFRPDRARILQDYVKVLPRDLTVCVELRHRDWFVGGEMNGMRRLERQGVDPGAVQETWELFRDLGIGTVITDTPGRRDVLHMRLTASVAFIRYVGNNMHPSDLLRLDAWVDRIKSWVDKGLREVYFFTHNPGESYSAEMCKYVVEQINLRCGTELKPPNLISRPAGNLSLFD